MGGIACALYDGGTGRRAQREAALGPLAGCTRVRVPPSRSLDALRARGVAGPRPQGRSPSVESVIDYTQSRINGLLQIYSGGSGYSCWVSMEFPNPFLKREI